MTPLELDVLAELGIKPLWQLRANAPATVQADAVLAPRQAPPAPDDASPSARPPRPPLPATRPQVVRPSAAAAPAVVEAAAALPPVAGLAQMGWAELEAAVRDCHRCGLCEQRKQAVLGVGDPQADWLFVGEGPGAEEDERGEPFVGAAGRLLDSMLGSIGLQRGTQVYIANAVKCRPPGNRTPDASEIEACKPYLLRQIELLQPRLIVAMGRPAAQTLLEQEIKIGSARGQVFERRGRLVVVTYHPAYLLRNPLDKARAWEDLCFSRARMAALALD